MKNNQIEKLLCIDSLDHYSDKEALIFLGESADFFYDKKLIKGIDHILDLGEQLKQRILTSFHEAYLNYIIGNLWVYKKKLLHHLDFQNGLGKEKNLKILWFI